MGSGAEAQRLYREGRLSDAIASLSEAMRADPTDVRGRTFLFELLCFSGDYDRARKQLDAISAADPEQALTATWYQEALQAEEQRREMFRTEDFPPGEDQPLSVSGTVNGESFRDLRDADPRIGPRLEAIVGGRYTWIPFEHLLAVEAEAPGRLRDLFWIPAEIEGSIELGGLTNRVFLPAMTPLASGHPDEAVQLGRVNEWRQLESGEEVPIGQKLLLVDGEEFPLLEVRELRFSQPET